MTFIIGCLFSLISAYLPGCTYILLLITSQISTECLIGYYSADLVLSCIRLNITPARTGNPLLSIYSNAHGMNAEYVSQHASYDQIEVFIVDRIVSTLIGLVLAFIVAPFAIFPYLTYAFISIFVIYAFFNGTITFRSLEIPIYLGIIILYGFSLIGFTNTVGVLLIAVAHTNCSTSLSGLSIRDIPAFKPLIDNLETKGSPYAWISRGWQAMLCGIMPGINPMMFTANGANPIYEARTGSFRDTIKLHTCAEAVTLGVFVLARPTGKSMLTDLLGIVSNPHSVLVLYLIGIGIGYVLYKVVGQKLIEEVQGTNDKEKGTNVMSELYIEVIISGVTIAFLSGFAVTTIWFWVILICSPMLLGMLEDVTICSKALPFIPALPIIMSPFL